MEFIERCPLQKINYLNSLTFAQFKQLGLCYWAKNDDDRRAQFSILKSYCETNIRTRGETKRIYAFTHKSPVEVGGRLYCGNSIQGISRIIRGFLMEGITTDIDMKNAHPTILKWLCDQHAIECPQLTYYVQNRSEILAKRSEESKILFLKSLNSDTKVKTTDMLLRAFDAECKLIQKQLTALPCYKHITDSVPSSREHNWLGSAINRIMCVYENKIIQSAMHVLNSRSIEVAAIMFDGCLVYGNHYDDISILTDITAHVNTEFPGLNMQWAYKQHETGVINMPDNFCAEKKESDGVNDDVEAAEKVFKLYPHWVCCRGSLFVFNSETGMYGCDKQDHLRVITSLSSRLHINGKDGATSRSYGNTLSLMEKLPNLIKMMCSDDDWMSRVQNSSLGKILFLNGYYDFRSEKFFSKEDFGFNPDIVFFDRINHSFEPFSDDQLEYMEDIKTRYFTNPLGQEMGEYLILNLARGLAGDMMKRILFGLGGTNCGKSVITKALRNACGGYVGIFNGENLAYRNTSNDEAQIMRWAMMLKSKRLIFSNEMKSTIDLNGNMIKKISSGGDGIVGRGHGQAEQEFTPHFLAVVMANDLPTIKPYDDAVDGRVKVISYKKEFVDEPSNEMELLKDPRVESEIETDEFKRCLVGILIHAYLDKSKFNFEPDCIREGKKEWVPEDRNCISAFLAEYELTNDPQDYVLGEEIIAWLESKKLGITTTKFGMELNRYCTIQKFDNCLNKQRKINGKPKQVRYGIRRIQFIDDPEYAADSC